MNKNLLGLMDLCVFATNGALPANDLFGFKAIVNGDCFGGRYQFLGESAYCWSADEEKRVKLNREKFLKGIQKIRL